MECGYYLREGHIPGNTVFKSSAKDSDLEHLFWAATASNFLTKSYLQLYYKKCFKLLIWLRECTKFKSKPPLKICLCYPELSSTYNITFLKISNRYVYLCRSICMKNKDIKMVACTSKHFWPHCTLRCAYLSMSHKTHAHQFHCF